MTAVSDWSGEEVRRKKVEVGPPAKPKEHIYILYIFMRLRMRVSDYINIFVASTMREGRRGG